LKNVLVIGGGVIGLCSAYYLAMDGHQVSVVDQSSMNFGASYVNAGYVSPSHIIPLAAPGMVSQGLKWMFNPASPLFIKPRLEKDFLKWAWAFKKSCSHENVERSIKAIKDISLLSSDLFSEIRASEGFTFHLENKGLLMLCQSEAMMTKEIEMAKIASEEGLQVSELSASEIKKMEPNVAIDVIGATHYQCDWHSTPSEFMKELKVKLEDLGTQFYRTEKVEDLIISDNKVKEVVTTNQRLKADEVVLAAGSWSNLLSKKLGIQIPLQAGKGYRINSQSETNISMPAILAEAKVAVTPMNGFTRYSGTMEITGINHAIRPERVEAIAQAVQKYYPETKISGDEKAAAACGLRPVSPDGRPYIGRSSKCENLTIAAGHAMMGWSMSTGTGKLVSEIISERKTSMDVSAFHPDRKF
jgi:D-amino-acid dehydrogenase